MGIFLVRAKSIENFFKVIDHVEHDARVISVKVQVDALDPRREGHRKLRSPRRLVFTPERRQTDNCRDQNCARSRFQVTPLIYFRDAL
jgi:hypothetical protein